MAIEKDQGQVTDQSEQKQESFEDLFARGWQDANPMDEAREKKEEPAKVETKAGTIEEECPGCPKKGEAPKKPPYKVIKHDGKDLAVESEEEFIALAQKGFDYTQKTQSLSDQRKEFDKEREEIKALSNKVIDLLGAKGEKGEVGKDVTGKEAGPAPGKTIDEIMKDYGVDEYTDPATRKLVTDFHGTRKELNETKSELSEVKKIAQVVLFSKLTEEVGKFMTEARVEFPFEEVVDSNGKNLTLEQGVNSLAKKFDEGRNRPLKEIVREVAQELSLSQKVVQERVNPKMANEMSTEDFKKGFPDLYERVSQSSSTKAVADHEKEMSKLPPSVESGRREVEVSPKDGDRKDVKTVAEGVDAFFNSPENLEGLLGVNR